MTITAIILVAISAFFHVFYNALFKGDSRDRSFAASMALAHVILTSPLFILSLFLIEMPLESILYALIGGALIGLYFFCLVRAYRQADFTLVYPVARSAPVFIVAWAAILVGGFPSATGLGGVLIVVAGCFLLPLKSFYPARMGLSVRDYWNKATLWALATALMTSFYSLADKKGVSIAPGVSGAFCYIFVESFATLMVLFILTAFVDGEKSFLRYFRKNPSKSFLTAGLCAAGYILVLLAFQTPSKVSYIVGFRQLSVVIGVLFGALFMTEKVTWPRFFGALVIFAGLVLIAIAK